MTQQRRRIRIPVGASTAAAVVAIVLGAPILVVLFPESATGVMRTAVVGFGAVGLWSVAMRLSASVSFGAHPAEDAPKDDKPQELKKIESAVGLSAWSWLSYYAGLRPALLEIATSRMRSHRRIDLEHDPASAQRLLGEAWGLLRKREFSEVDRAAPGPDERTLTEIVYTLERL